VVLLRAVRVGAPKCPENAVGQLKPAEGLACDLVTPTVPGVQRAPDLARDLLETEHCDIVDGHVARLLQSWGEEFTTRLAVRCHPTR
jgi:hypothetical protein